MNENTFHTNLNKLIEKQKEILSHYNCKEELKAIHALFEKQRTKKAKDDIDERLKSANNHYVQYMRLTKKIQEMKNEISMETDIQSLESLEDTICSNTDLGFISDSNDSISNILNSITSSSEDNSNESEEETHSVLQCANCK